MRRAFSQAFSCPLERFRMLMTSPGLRVRVNLLARAHFGYPQTVQAVNDALNPFAIAEQNHAVGRLAGNR
ncbi:hypothetical protein [Microcoleus sp. OTE_8_concoct_300]|uniref:hypothetical protein n=1 Tax=Microcoleus sp. OTE_8_concoct_300 TaxID=2964710 RepID=UPI00403F6DFA